MTYQDRARWSEELRKIPAELSELNLVLNHRRKPNHKQRIADLQHRQAELKAWLDGRTGA
jgi:hypothetical protein